MSPLESATNDLPPSAPLLCPKCGKDLQWTCGDEVGDAFCEAHQSRICAPGTPPGCEWCGRIRRTGPSTVEILPLRCFYDGGDHVIAYDEADASVLWNEWAGVDAAQEHESEWEEVPADHVLTVSPDEPVDSTMTDARTQTVAAWIAERGRGWFCTENF